MLAPAEAALAARDTALPGLARILDDDAMAAQLAALAPEAGIESLRGCYLRYKPGTRCVAAYRVRAGGAEHLVHAVAHGGDAAEKLAKSRERRAVAGLFGAGVHADAALRLVLRAFPNDARIPYLRRIAEPDGARRLAKRAGASFARGASLRAMPLAYKPERRFVARLDGDSGPTAVLRLYEPEAFADAAPAAGVFASRDALHVAACLGVSPRHGAIALAWQEGAPLDLHDRAALETLGAALAELHAQVPPLRTLAPDREAVTAADGIGCLLPGQAERARRLACQIAVRIGERREPRRALHGDLHARQVLERDGAAILLDLDRAGAGEPAQDFASFAAHGVAEGPLDPDAMLDQLACVLAGYRHVAAPPELGAIALFAAAAQLAVAVHHFRSREPDWPGRIEASLAHAETWLARSVVRRSAAGPSSRDPALPTLEAALDPERAGAALGRALGGDLALRDARLVRHKPGRRALVEYEIERDGVPATLLGKLGARGLDRRRLRVQEELHRTLTGGVASVPEPLGAVPELELWLQRKVAGVSGEELVADAAFAARVAEATHALHCASVEASRRHDVTVELHLLRARLPIVAWLRPELERDIARLLDACERIARALSDAPACGIHRDLHPGQVLDGAGHVVLLDLDLYCTGPPALDVGNYRAHLIEAALRTTGAPDAYRAAEHALVDRHVALAGESLRPAISDWTSLALARHVYLSTQYPERRDTTAALLALALARVEAPRRDAA